MGEKEKKEKRNIKAECRLTEQESNDLQFMSYKTGKKRSEVMRDALKMYMNLVKNT